MRKDISHYKEFNKAIKKCFESTIGHEETRPSIHGMVHHCETTKSLVSINGYAMTFDRTNYSYDDAGKTYDLINYKEYKFDFPKVSQFYPNFSKLTKREVTIDERYAVKSKKLNKVFFYQDENDTELIKLSFEAIGGTVLFCLDSKYLVPLKGLTLEVYSSGELNPVSFMLGHSESVYVVMPVKV